MRRTCGALVVILAWLGASGCAQKYERPRTANAGAETLAPPPAAQGAARQIQPSNSGAAKPPQRLIFELVLSEDQGNFRFGSRAIPDSTKAKLDEVFAETTSDPKSLRFEIEGHTDNAGAQAINERIGLERAEAVKRYLYEQHGVPLNSINIVSYGETKPVSSNRTREGRASNRRVVVKVLAGEPDNAATVSVYFATDRKLAQEQALEYSGERNPSGTLRMGKFDVSIPRDHRLGSVERPTIWTLWREDPSHDFLITRRMEMPYEDFYGDIRRRVGQSRSKEVLVFIHGFNVSFESAIYRTAQIAYDLEFDGAPILYSWPSEDRFRSYPGDLNNNDWTVPHLKSFLSDVAAKSGANLIHLVAHSMGNRALMNAMQVLILEQPQLRGRFAQVMLTAPDIDADTFAQLAGAVLAASKKVTLYASSNDAALMLSSAYQGYNRAGDTRNGVVVVPDVDTIDVSQIDTNFIGHFYYAENRSVLSDMYWLIRERPVSERFGLRPIGEPPRRHWTFKP